jgi:hypothetical protein
MERRSRWRVVKDQVGKVWVEALNRIQLFDKSIDNAVFGVQIEDLLPGYPSRDDGAEIPMACCQRSSW